MSAGAQGGDSPSGEGTRRSHGRVRRVVQATASLALVVAIFAYLFTNFTDFSAVWDQVKAMTWLEMATLGLAAAWNLMTYCLVLVPVLPGLTYPQAMVVSQSSTAVANTLPGGAGLGIGITYAMYSSWGFSRPAITLSILLSGVWNSFTKLAMPVLALALLALQGRVTAARVTAAVAGVAALVVSVAVFALMLRGEGAARRVGDVTGRAVGRVRALFHRGGTSDWGAAAVDFRRRTIGLVRTRWAWLTTMTLVSHLSLYLVLLLALRHVGVSEREVSWVEVLAAFAFVRLISALPITPGGVGVVELALTAALVAAGGDRAQVVAAVLVYRILTYFVPVPLGALTYVVWRRNSRWRRPRGTLTWEPASPGG